MNTEVTQLTDSLAVRVSPDVVARRLDRAGVLVHLPTNLIYELNETGMRVWELLASGLAPADLAKQLVAEFDVTEAAARVETAALLERFRAAGLLAS